MSKLGLSMTILHLIHVALLASVSPVEKAIYSKKDENPIVQYMKGLLKNVGITSYEDDVIPMLIEFKNGTVCCNSPS